MQCDIKRVFVLPFFVGALTACPAASTDGGGDTIETTLSGYAPMSRGAMATVVKVEGEIDETRASIDDTSASIDQDGRFVAKLGQLKGDFLIRAVGGSYVEAASAIPSSHGAQGLSAMATNVPFYSASKVVLTPWTDLATAAHIESGGKIAYSETKQAIEHFLSCGGGKGVGLLDVEPDDPTQEGKSEVRGLSPQVRMGLTLAGLSQQAALMEKKLDVSAGTRLGVADILAGLRSDMEDGILDGFDRGGHRVLVQNIPFDGEALRSSPIGLVEGIRHFVDSPRNKTGIRSRDIADWLECLASYRGPLFGGKGGGHFDKSVPKASCALTTRQGEPLSWSRPQRGTVALRPTVADPRRIENLVVRLNGETLQASPSNETLTYGQFLVDTRQLEDGSHEVELLVTDRAGNHQNTTWQLYTMNHAPAFALDRLPPVHVGSEQPLRVVGTSQSELQSASVELRSATGKSETVHLEVDGRKILEKDIHLPFCNQEMEVLVAVRDSAGNESKQAFKVRCDDQAPRLVIKPVSVLQDFSGGQLWADETVWRSEPTFEKFFNNMDYAPGSYQREGGKLPALRFLVDDDARAGGTAAEDLTVDYRYSYDGHAGKFVRDWETLPVETEYHLPLSYQTLLPRSILDLGQEQIRDKNFIARSNAGDIHRLEVRVADKAGNVKVEQFLFHLHVMGEPVRMQCRWNSVAQSKTWGEPSQILNFAQGNAPLLHVDYEWHAARPPGSLAPNGRVVVASKPVHADWSINKSLKYTHISWTKHGGNPPAGWPHEFDCDDNYFSGNDWTLWFDDEQCTAHPSRTIGHQCMSMVDVHLNQSCLPSVAKLPLDGMHPASIFYAGATSEPLAAAEDLGKLVGVQYKLRKGRDKETHSGAFTTPDYITLEERSLIAGGTVQVQPLTAPELHVEGQIPPPLRLDLADACRQQSGPMPLISRDDIAPGKCVY